MSDQKMTLFFHDNNNQPVKSKESFLWIKDLKEKQELISVILESLERHEQVLNVLQKEISRLNDTVNKITKADITNYSESHITINSKDWVAIKSSVTSLGNLIIAIEQKGEYNG